MPLQKKLIFVGMLNFFLLLILFFSGVFKPVEHKIYDWIIQLRGIRPPLAEIVIVSVDDISIESLKTKWPWNRGYFAQGLQKIAADSPKAIGLDFIFSEPGTQDEDQKLNAALDKISAVPVVCGVHLFQEVSRVNLGREKIFFLETGEKLPVFNQMQYGFINIFTDEDGFIRRTDLTRTYEQKQYDLFALALLKNTHPQLYSHYQSSGDPIRLINFAGPEKTYHRISFYQVLKNFVPQGYFKNKIVLLGPTFKDSQDFHPTPFLDYDGLKSRMAGVEIHANILENLMTNSFYKEVPHLLNLFLLVLLNALVLCLFLLNLNFSRLISLELLAIFLYTAFVFTQAFLFRTVLQGFLPLFTCLVLLNILLILQQIHKNKEMARELGELRSTDLAAMENFCRQFDITRREKDIVLLLMNNLTKNEISKKLFISSNTVKRHIYNIYKKTKIESREELLNLIYPK